MRLCRRQHQPAKIKTEFRRFRRKLGHGSDQLTFTVGRRLNGKHGLAPNVIASLVARERPVDGRRRLVAAAAAGGDGGWCDALHRHAGAADVGGRHHGRAARDRVDGSRAELLGKSGPDTERSC